MPCIVTYYLYFSVLKILILDFFQSIYPPVNKNTTLLQNSAEQCGSAATLERKQSGKDQKMHNMIASNPFSTDKVNLIALVLDNLEIFYRHHRKMFSYIDDPEQPNTSKPHKVVKVS